MASSKKARLILCFKIQSKMKGSNSLMNGGSKDIFNKIVEPLCARSREMEAQKLKNRKSKKAKLITTEHTKGHIS